MGRKNKVVIGSDGLDRREEGYYSTPSFVAEFLARELLAYKPNTRLVLDPCVGKGELAAPFAREGLNVIGIDITDRKPQHCSEFIVADFLEMAAVSIKNDLFAQSNVPSADIIVANPPYNCHETKYIKDNKQQLVASFGKSTALNMYSLFIRAIIECAKEGAIIGLVVHDSFLTAVGHKDLRDFILKNCAIRNIHLCPTSLFLKQGADVRTCLLIVEKMRPKDDSYVEVSNRTTTVLKFESVLRLREFERRHLSEIKLDGQVDNNEIVIGLPRALANLFSGQRLFQVAPCITGVSTGNDAKYLRPIKQAGFSIPFYKNPASRKYYAEPDGYITDEFDKESRLVSNFMVRNRNLLLKGGLSCSSMGVAFGATIRPPNTLCGVNPNIIVEEADKWWLLAYLNSRLCLYLLRGVLLRSNMVTAGYASRIPVPEFGDRIKSELSRIAQIAYNNELNKNNSIDEQVLINKIVEDTLMLGASVVEQLQAFSADPTRLT